MVPSIIVPGCRRMFTLVDQHGMVPLPGVFPPVGFSMQAHVFFRDTWHHAYITSCFCGKCFYFPCYNHINGTHSSEGKRRQGKKDQRPRSNSGPTLYRGVSATQATETGRDPSSPIAPMYRSQVCRYPATLKTCASRLVMYAM